MTVPFPVYSTPFIAQLIYSDVTAAGASYTVPTGKVAVLRSADFFVDTAGDMFMGVIRGGDFIPFHSIKNVPAHGCVHWAGHIVLLAGHEVKGQWVSGGARVLVDGYLLNQL